MPDPFVEMSRRLTPLRDATAMSAMVRSSALPASLTVFSVLLSTGGVLYGSLFLDGSARRAVVVGVVLACVAASLVVLPLLLGLFERLFALVFAFRVRRGVRRLPMCSVVRAFQVAGSGRSSRFRVGAAERVLAYRVLAALAAEPGGGRLLAVLSGLAGRAGVLADGQVAAAEVLEVLYALGPVAEGCAQDVAWMLVDEMWGSGFGGSSRPAADGFVAAVGRVGRFSEAQLGVFRAFSGGRWRGSLDDLLEVSERVGV